MAGLNATLSEMQAALLYAQIQAIDVINNHRLHIWHRYQVALAPLGHRKKIKLPKVPPKTTHNANVFWIRLTDATLRSSLILHLDKANAQAYSQFMPLHSSPYGRIHGYLAGEDRVTSLAASQILLLPIHADLNDAEQDIVIKKLLGFWAELPHKGSSIF